MTGWRLATGGRIDRDRPLRFSFDGAVMQGFTGDTLASALIANGRHLVGRSFKYHRPRGLLAAGPEEPNGLVTVRRDAARTTPNLRATEVELHDGLVATSQNRWPSLAFDVAAVNDRFARFLPAGFYYKTFMWPAGAWKSVYEPRIRAMAGLGRAAEEADPDRYAQTYAHCDLLVVGSGPAGLHAALEGGRAGLRVILCDEQAELGGSLLAPGDATIGGAPAEAWRAAAVLELAAMARVRLLPRTTAFGYFAHNFIGLVERATDHLDRLPERAPRERLWQVRAGEVVLATGAIERPLVFPGNDRPGVMLASAARLYVERWAALPGRHAVVLTAGDEGYRAALALHRAGAAIRAIADLRAQPTGALVEAARAAGLRLLPATSIVGTEGGLRVREAELAPLAGGPGETVLCDLVVMSGGFTPSVHLFSQSRGKLRFDERIGAFLPAQAAERVRCVGACAGRFDLAQILPDVRAMPFEPGSHPAPLPKGDGRGRAFVDFQNDVTSKDLELAAREGFRSIEHAKRYTTNGMATDQGKTSNINGLALMAAALGKTPPEVGHTTFRMPYTPVTFGALAGISRGQLFDPVRTTPMHDRAVALGAVFEDVGAWKRARYFPRPGEGMNAAVQRECRAVREAAGMFDASTLGKIEVVGPDAAEFMNRVYTAAWTKLQPGRCRYGVLLREDGFVLDDGVIGRLAPDRFHVTTTTGGAARVLHVMEDYRQTEWPALRVWLTSVTEEWAVVAVQGPQARHVLEPLVEGVDLGAAAMPHMAVREAAICGVPTRLMRVSFTGELGFEVNVPADHGAAVWERIAEAGRPYGITPYGTEAMHVLRAEKGYIIVGQETDGTATPDDVGLGWAVSATKPDFIGKRSLQRAALREPGRKQLVGLLTDDPRTVLAEGAQLVADPAEPVPMTMLGHVTSAYASAALGRSIALAMLAGGRGRIGERLHVPMPGGAIPVTVVAPLFYDPEGARLNG